MVDLAASCRLPTAGESAGPIASGDVVPLGQPWPVGGSPDFERRAASGVDADGGDARGAHGQGATQVGGDGAVTIELTGEVIQPRQGGRRNRDVQVGQPALLGGEHERPLDKSLVAWLVLGIGCDCVAGPVVGDGRRELSYVRPASRNSWTGVGVAVPITGGDRHEVS